MNQGLGNGRKMIIWLVPAGVLVLVLVFIYAGRQRIPAPPEIEVTPEPVHQSAVEERMNDPEYVEALRELTEERRSLSAAAHAVRRKMDARATELVQELKAEETTMGAEEPEAERSVAESPAEGEISSVESPELAGDALDELLAERLKLRMESDPEMQQLEGEMEQAQLDLRLLQRRVEALVRNRMHEQVASRQHLIERPERPGPAAGIRRQEHATPDFLAERIVITNLPPEVAVKLPTPPDRRPPTPSGTGGLDVDANADGDSLETKNNGD